MTARIVHLGTELTWRGGEAQMMLLAGGLRVHGYDVSFVARPGSELERTARAAGFEVDPLDFRWEMSPFAMRHLAAILRERRTSVVHVHDGRGVWIGKLAAWLAGGVRVVATRRVDFPVSGPLKWSRGMDRVVAISEAVRRALLARGIPESRLRLIHSGIDPERFASFVGAGAFRTECGLATGGPLVVTVGALTDHKGTRYLIEAMPEVARAHPGARLVIVGEGELRGELEGRISQLGLGGSVRMLGFRRDIPAILHAADVVVFPSVLEGLCTSAMDAMACRKVVVATDAGGLPEVVAEGVTGLVVPAGDSGRLAAAITKLLADEPLRLKMGEAGRRRLEESFTARRMVERYIEIYEELLGGDPPAAPPGSVEARGGP